MDFASRPGSNIASGAFHPLLARLTPRARLCTIDTANTFSFTCLFFVSYRNGIIFYRSPQYGDAIRFAARELKFTYFIVIILICNKIVICADVANKVTLDYVAHLHSSLCCVTFMVDFLVQLRRNHVIWRQLRSKEMAENRSRACGKIRFVKCLVEMSAFRDHLVRAPKVATKSDASGVIFGTFASIFEINFLFLKRERFL